MDYSKTGGCRPDLSFSLNNGNSAQSSFCPLHVECYQFWWSWNYCLGLGQVKRCGGGGDTEGGDHSENNGTVLTSTESERCSKMVAVITINVNYIDLKSTVFLFLKLYTTHRTNKYLLYWTRQTLGFQQLLFPLNKDWTVLPNFTFHLNLFTKHDKQARIAETVNFSTSGRPPTSPPQPYHFRTFLTALPKGIPRQQVPKVWIWSLQIHPRTEPYLHPARLSLSHSPQ